MEDQIQSGTDVFDVLSNVDLSEVDTQMPLLKNGAYDFTIAEMSRELSERSGGTYLLLVLKLATDGAEDIKGNPINPGYPVRHIISLVTKDKYDPIRNIAQFHEALGNKAMQFDPTFEAYIGQTITAKTKVEPEREDKDTGEVYQATVRVASFVRPKTDSE